MEQRHTLAMAVGAAALAAGLLVGATVVGFAIASPSLQSAGWFRPSLYVAVTLAVVGIYLLVAPYFGAPVPQPRSIPIWRGWWSRLPFSWRSRERSAQARYQRADGKLRDRIENEVQRLGFTAVRSGQSVLDAVIEGKTSRDYWVVGVAAKPYFMLGFGPSGNVTDVQGSTLNAPDVAERIRQFDELVTAAREWPETKERQRLRAKLRYSPSEIVFQGP